MTQSEINVVLELHLKWIRGEIDGKRANLTGADLTGADLTGAYLTGANLDFSSWPLWCGSLRAKIGRRLFCQLAYHMCRVIVDDQECVEARKALVQLANEFHRVRTGELPKIESAEEE